MTGRRARGIWAAAVGVVALGASAWALRASFGDSDPVSATIGILVAVLLGVPATVAAVRALWWQQTGVADLVVRLAGAVGRAEQRARHQLLGGHDRAIDVEFDVRPTSAHNAAGARARGRLQEVAAYYQRLRPRRMVITGAPGAGKTVLAVELVLALLEARTADDPVPVRLTAASWDLSTEEPVKPADVTQRMERWLVDHLVDAYDLSKRSAQSLVQAGRILPVVDGLDELDATDTPGFASRAGQALRAFNAYQRLRSKAQLIVTCRSEQYQSLTAEHTWLEDAARVEVRPVSAAKARAFITGRVVNAHRWQPVLDIIKRDRGGPLAAGLSTPWRLTLATVVYEQRGPDGGFVRDPVQLTDPALNTPDAVRDRLLGLFIPAALQTAPTRTYDLVRAHRWLAVLAGYLDRNTSGRTLGGRTLSGTDIVLHELWPLAGFRAPRVVTFTVLVVAGFAALLIPLPNEPAGLSALLSVRGGIMTLALFLMVHMSWSEVWPQPLRLNLDRLHTSSSRRRLANHVVFGLVFGLVLGLVVGLVLVLTIDLAPVVGLVFGLAFGLAIGLTTGLVTGLIEDGGIGTPAPRSIVRDDLVGGLVIWLGLALAIGLAGFLAGLFAGWLAFDFTAWSVVWRALGLAGSLGVTYLPLSAFGLGSGYAGGLTGARYFALLLCSRRWSRRYWLPWRLGRFLDDCYQAGLLRIAGSGYQFRHRELQDYLARHQFPDQGSPEAASSAKPAR